MLGEGARRWLREPLVRFGLAGALLYALSLSWEPPGEVTPPVAVITVPSAVANGVERERWLDEEVLVRSARELQLDELDLVVRRRLAQQMRFLVEDTRPVAEPDDAALQRWLAEHEDRYRLPPTLSLHHVFVSRGAHGARLDADAEALLAPLRAGVDPGTLGDPFFAGHQLQGVAPAQLSERFGAAFAEAVQSLEVGAWLGPLASSYGLHLVRVDERTPGRAAALPDVRARVRADVLAERRAQANRAALDALRAQYGVPPAASSAARPEP